MVLQQVNNAERAINAKLVDVLEGRGWQPTIKAYTGYGSTGWIRVMGRLLLGRPEDRRVPDSLARGWRNFMSVHLEGRLVTMRVGGKEFSAFTDPAGFVDIRLDVDLEPGWHEVAMLVDGAEPARAPVRVISEEPQTAVISDIDDTVLVTSLPRPMIAAWNTFVLNEHARRPVPGMAVLYERLSQHYRNPPVFYLSTGAWNVHATLTRFLGRNLYPAGPMLLTDWGPTEDRWFRSGMDHKRKSLARLVRELPQLRWLLIGDDGQHDPDIYAEFARMFPDSVLGVGIRQLSPAEQVLASGSPWERHHGDQPGHVPWVSAPNGAGLAAAFAEHNLL